MALRRVNLQVAAGECLALVGHNGSGKTTLLRIAAQLVRPSRGQIEFHSGEATLDTNAVKGHVGMVAHHTMVYDEMTAEENLVFFCKLNGLPDSADRARQALEPAGLARRSADLVRTFSRGMRQRLAIARALLVSPRLLLLDEPAAGLDTEGQQWLGETLGRLRSSGCTMMMSTHGHNETHALVTRAIRLEDGVITHDSQQEGTPGRVLAMSVARTHTGQDL